MSTIKESAAKNGNGKAITEKPELSNLVVSGKPEKGKEIAEVKNEPSKTEVMTVIPPAQREEAPVKKVLTIEEKLKKLDELNELVERRDVIEEALTKVSNFYISAAGNAQLKFTDSKGGSFGIAHPSVIGEMVHLAKSKLKEELEAIDSKINFDF